MDKRLIFPGNSNKERDLFIVEDDRNYLRKHAAAYHPKIASYIEKAKPMPDLIQVLLTALGAGETWGCFLAGTPVLLAEGWSKPIEEIEVGEEVISHTGQVQKVLEPLARYYDGQLYHHTLAGFGGGTESTAEHPYYVVRGEQLIQARRQYYKKKETYEQFIAKLVYEFHRADDLQAGDFVTLPFSTDDVITPELGDQDFAYLMGWYLAEGVVVKNYAYPGSPYHKVILTLGAHEEDSIKKIVSLLAAKGKKTFVTEKYQGSNATRIEISWTEFTEACLKHLGRGSRSKFLSQAVLQMPRPWQRAFISAYIDGDGCQTKAKGRYFGAIRSSTVSKQLAVCLVKMTARFGYLATFAKCKQHDTCKWSSGSTIYAVNYERAFANELDIPRFLRVESNQCAASAHIDIARGYVLFPISGTDVKEYAGTVYNLSVAEDNSYCVSGLAVHNCNVNGDFFPEKSLEHDGSDYGHRTFLTNAHFFNHHVNNDPALAKGKVLHAVWNEKAKRVELIIGIDPSLDPDAAREISDGTNLAFSMGTKVPFDLCSICGNRAKTRAEYCDHLRYQMNMMDPTTGRLVCAYNTFPRFFDISRVLIPADKTAYMWAKVASAANPFNKIGSAQLAELPAGKLADMEYIAKIAEAKGHGLKTAASMKKADVQKSAEIMKRIPAVVHRLDHIIPPAKALLESEARTIPLAELQSMQAQAPTLAHLLSTFMAMAMEPNLAEAIHLVKGHTAESLAKLPPVHPSLFIPELGRRLAFYAPERSYAIPHVVQRITLIANRLDDGDHDLIKKAETIRELAYAETHPKKEPIHPGFVVGLLAALYALMGPHAGPFARGMGKLVADHPFMATALGAGLLGTYRSLQAPANAGNYSVDDPKRGFYNNDWQSRFARMQARPVAVIKTGAAKIDRELAAKVYGASPVLWLTSRMEKGRQEASPEQPGPIAKAYANNPDLMVAGLIGEHISGRPVSSRVENLLKSGKKFFKTASIRDPEFLLSVPETEQELVWDLAVLDAATRIERKIRGEK